MGLISVIAIVGRPNVGKSTLFNRLTHSRQALVSDFPGMTRDRQYGEAYLNDKHFIVIDTAGIAAEETELDQLARTQTLQAIQEADQVLFLVDGREGLTPSDRHIAETLRTLNKKITLVINKMEGKSDELHLSEFYELGFGNPNPISSAHGIGIDELIDALIPESTELEETEEASSIKFAIVGRPNVGKSTLTNRMLGEERVIVFDKPGTTRDSIFIPFERFDKRYTIIDTAGIRRRGKIFEATEKFSVVKTLKAIDAANVVLFVIDAREGVTDQDLRLLGFILETGKALVLAINKWDGMSLDEKNRTRDMIDRRLHFLTFARIHTISALHGTGVGNLFNYIQEAYESATKEFSTSEITNLLLKAVSKHTPPLVRGRRIKLRYAHPGGHNPPRIVIHGNQVSSLPNSYIRYLAHFFQEELDLKGTPVKIELKSSDNPYKDKKNVLTERQKQKRKRLIKHKR